MPETRSTVAARLLFLSAVVAFDVVTFSLLALRASQAAALLPTGDASSWVAVDLLASLAAAVWVAALGWALVLQRPWARTAQALTCLALAMGLAGWVLPTAGPGLAIAGQATAFAVAVLVAAPASRLWAQPVTGPEAGSGP